MNNTPTLVAHVAGNDQLPEAEVYKARLIKAPVKKLSRFVAALQIYLLASFILFWAAMALPSLEDPQCFGILKDKHAILDHAASPKVIFIGGSNLLFGLDGDLVKRELGMQVVNMGVCLMFPLPYLFEEIKAHVKKATLLSYHLNTPRIQRNLPTQ